MFFRKLRFFSKPCYFSLRSVFKPVDSTPYNHILSCGWLNSWNVPRRVDSLFLPWIPSLFELLKATDGATQAPTKSIYKHTRLRGTVMFVRMTLNFPKQQLEPQNAWKPSITHQALAVVLLAQLDSPIQKGGSWTTRNVCHRATLLRPWPPLRLSRPPRPVGCCGHPRWRTLVTG